MGTRVGFIGLGTMGSRIAAHLARAGHELVVFNRTRVRAQEFVAAHGGRAVDSPAEVAVGAMPSSFAVPGTPKLLKKRSQSSVLSAAPAVPARSARRTASPRR